MRPFFVLLLSVVYSGVFAQDCCVKKAVHGKDYYVSPNGNDANNGSKAHPFKTITAAANVAMPGDTITVHAGVYREWVSPPRGGLSEKERIWYRAAPGEKVILNPSCS